MNFLDKILEIIEAERERLGAGGLNLKENEYHVFLKDAHINIYLDEETRTIKVDVELFEEGRMGVYFSALSLEEIM